jgi:hypothetical protein
MPTELDIKDGGVAVEAENNKSGIVELSFTAEEEKLLLRKIDLHLLPTIWIMYLLSYMDRTKCVDWIDFL